jgi:NAD(P)-dependent dehydrogenase (short-subunit alcohol dehydrogenase family)
LPRQNCRWRETFTTGLSSLTSRTPAGRWGNPDDLTGVAVFLASRACGYVTGTAIPADGGYSIKGERSALRTDERLGATRRIESD